MDYKNFTNYLSERLVVSREIFSLDLEKEKLISDLGLKIYKPHELNTHYINGYYYSENESERWKSITLKIPSGILDEVLACVKDYLNKNNIEYSDKDDEGLFAVDVEGFNCLLGKKAEGFYEIQIALRN
ncbi:hypothetical protein Q763_01550 [Flavobacterium beibuense F44-8]|uniref:Uncharacterized protein n=1 Tax=Flavobacterium beibuense F44-8 TaxID=1406840 RepID=A0A0A2LWR7_9FLAO|nr:hypothetical protein [Flavobacterium beibuense]KGO84454.1 hypothetical protein Q763_01550 [Flavobacterium beibuense F44-8]